jgi:hypothetical protein
MLKFWELLWPHRHFLPAAKLLSTGEGKAVTDEARISLDLGDAFHLRSIRARLLHFGDTEKKY